MDTICLHWSNIWGWSPCFWQNWGLHSWAEENLLAGTAYNVPGRGDSSIHFACVDGRIHLIFFSLQPAHWLIEKNLIYLWATLNMDADRFKGNMLLI